MGKTETATALSKMLVEAGYPKEIVDETDKEHIKWVTEFFPKIDQLNIQSTGDIHTTAQNHQRLKAKRIEILSDVDESNFSEDLEGENRPFGDRDGDDSYLYAGDAHIRAKNRIVIKAWESIELQAGRSSIIINDEGITIASRKTQSNIITPGTPYWH
ncbi:MAG: hypothetical protein LBB48_06025 [Treponema sp.]|nr:hypothetical protein [Treponema sp.]